MFFCKESYYLILMKSKYFQAVEMGSVWNNEEWALENLNYFSFILGYSFSTWMILIGADFSKCIPHWNCTCHFLRSILHTLCKIPHSLCCFSCSAPARFSLQCRCFRLCRWTSKIYERSCVLIRYIYELFFKTFCG